MPSELELLGRLVLAVVLGGAVGVERELTDQAAGLRTHVLLTLGSCLFTLVSAYGFREFGAAADPTRIAAQIVTGIGFLGGGAILRQGLNVRGLTTAATIWATTALGVAVGAGSYLLAVGATVLILITLVVLRRVRDLLRRFAISKEEFAVRVGPDFDLAALHELARAQGVTVRQLDHERDGGSERLLMLVRLPARHPPEQFMRQVGELPGVRGVEWEG
jgi:putative Mg2+ transporter-C (MgtC) family protein